MNQIDADAKALADSVLALPTDSRAKILRYAKILLKVDSGEPITDDEQAFYDSIEALREAKRRDARRA